MTDNAVAVPCRNCQKPTRPHCASGCDWNVCPACGALDSSRLKRYVRPLGRGPERQEDGSVREVSRWESVDYG